METLTREQMIEKAKALIAGQPTKTLVQSLREIGPQIAAARAKADITRTDDDYLMCQALNQPRSWIVQELISRHPEIDIALDIAFEQAGDNDIDFDAVMIAAIPASER